MVIQQHRIRLINDAIDLNEAYGKFQLAQVIYEFDFIGMKASKF